MRFHAKADFQYVPLFSKKNVKIKKIEYKCRDLILDIIM